MSEKKINILLVEDEKSHTDLICRSFDSASDPVSVTVARNLHEAHNSIAKSTPDLIIADFLLPDGKGMELILSKREESPYPIIILTSHGDEQIAVEAMKAGAFDYIVKSEVTLGDMPHICERVMREWNHTIERRLAEAELHMIIEGTSTAVGEDFFYELVKHLQAVTKAHVVFCAELVDHVNLSARTLRLWIGEGFADNFEWNLIGTPCEHVIKGETIFFAENVQAEFPDDHWLATVGAESYLAIPFINASGNVIGHMGILDDKLKLVRQHIEGILRLFAARAGGELERKQTNTKQKFTQFAVDNNADATYWVKSDAKISYANKAACQALGYSYEELICMRVPDIDPDFPDEYWSAHWQEMKEAGTLSFEAHHKTKAGLVFPVEIQTTYLEYEGEEYICAFARNITKRKKTEQQLRKLSHAVEQSSGTIIITDTKGNIEYANPKFTQLTGFTHEEAIGKNPRVLKSGKTSPEVYKELWKTITSGNEWRGEFCNRKKNGELYWESASISPVKNDAGIIINFIAIKDDITERKRLEDAFLRSEKLRSLGAVTAGVAHEFNNMLAIISGNVQLLEERYKDHEELTKALRTIKKATNDGAQISRRMLKFTKTDIDTAGFVPFDISELINQAINFTMPRWKNMAQAKGINYHMDTENIKRVPSILCNPAELREVFVNIINNALDAMPGGGCMSFGSWSKEDTVYISVSDNGEGMSEEARKNIFDPFFTTKTALGTGLGMSTAYGMVARHGGNIEVESAVRRGSTFTLKFPAATKADSPKESPEPKQEIKTNSLRILVVDDEGTICNILDEFFSKRGHLVRTVYNGREAIILTKVADYDLVLCDIAMPEVSGYDVIKALNKLEKRPKIGLITGCEEKLEPIDDEELKVDFIIKKPFDFSELTKRINELFI